MPSQLFVYSDSILGQLLFYVEVTKTKTKKYVAGGSESRQLHIFPRRVVISHHPSPRPTLHAVNKKEEEGQLNLSRAIIIKVEDMNLTGQENL
jgi:hypothetical protein